ncbi:MAG: aminotransferase class I/II-fold pyridoxal phosphate-dependent enzyme [Thermoanaerobaculia bacterium]|nr:aminotransferase class I/II-fold pyridoxal phosphate-dependent enzyme [Thermoanaerobaculia bacterium]
MHIDPRDVEICVHDQPIGEPPHPTSVPVFQTSLFSFPSLEALGEGFLTESRTHVYSRGQNPTVEELERKLATLERGERCKAFSSGMAAISAVFFGLLRAGDHVVFVNQIYGPTLQLARQFRRFDVEHDVVLELDPDAVERAIRPETRLIWVESPGTMLFRLVDLEAIAGLARSRGILSAIDNTWATPLLQKPVLLGFDLVMHTATKYIGGHSDVMAGALITTEQRMETIFRRAYLLQGGALGPWDAWLLLRGLRTLPQRLRHQEEAALDLARWLEEHSAVASVHHPALTADAELAGRQMTGFAGVFSFVLRDGRWQNVCRVVDGLRKFRIGVSWGGVDSLVLAPKPFPGSETQRKQSLPPGLVRLSVGLEDVEALRSDLSQALSR